MNMKKKSPPQSVCLHLVWICAALVSERLDKFYWYSICNSSSVIYRCTVNMNILAPKTKVLKMGPPKKSNGDFLETAMMVLNYGDHFPKYNCIGCVSRKTSVRALGAQTWNVIFLETGFTGLTDFTVVRYSATNNGLQNNNRFRFQGEVTEVSPIRKYAHYTMSLHRFFVLYI
jgi:hypothetical protein